jgi:hypothetical protein
MPEAIQRSLSGGELSPSLQARDDQVKYATGLKTQRNTLTRSDGGSQNRNGGQFISEIADSTSVCRLIPFEFNDDQTYILEFTDLVMRVWKEGVLQATVVSPFTEEDLAEIRFSQSADVITFAHPDYSVRELTRTSDSVWAFSTATIGVDATFAYISDSLSALNLSVGVVGTATVSYCVTGVLDSGEETPPLGMGPVGTITAISRASTCEITIGAGFGTCLVGDLIYIDHVAGMTELNGRYARITYKTGTTLIGINVDSQNYTAYTSGGNMARACVASALATTPTSANPDVITTYGPPRDYLAATVIFPGGNIKAFNVYKESSGIFGFIGTTQIGTFSNPNITPDTTINPPETTAFFVNTVEKPVVCSYLQQRRVFANFSADTERVAMSSTGKYHHFVTLRPVVDSDSVVFSMAGRKVSQVKHIADVGKMVLFTSTGEWVAEGGAAGFVTPSEINLKQQSGYGCNYLAPIVIDGSAIFVQARGSIVRDLTFDFNTDGYRGNDLTQFAKHLFENNTIVDWSYQQVPHSIVWAVRDDGVLLSLTYVKEQQIVAWAHHDFENGLVENVCCVPEGTEDAVYIVVKRTIDGSDVRYIERFYTRFVDEDAIEDSVFMDSALSYDGWHAGSVTMTLSGGTDWDYTEELTLTASGSTFTAADVGNEIHLVGSAGDLIRCSIIGYTGVTVVTVTASSTVPASMRSIAITEWGEAVDVVSGIDHLEGEDVSVFADGFVVASPNNPSYSTVTVSGGEIELSRCYVKIHVGLPITADIETLGAGPMAEKNDLPSSVTTYLEKTRGGFVGGQNPDTNPRNEDSETLYGLIEFKPRSDETYDEPADLKTGPYTLGILPEWSKTGRIFIRQVDPLPMSVLAIVTRGLVGGAQ